MLKYITKATGIVGYIIQYGCWTHCTFEYIGDFVVVNEIILHKIYFPNSFMDEHNKI